MSRRNDLPGAMILAAGLLAAGLVGCEEPELGCSDRPVTAACDYGLGYDRCMDEGGCWVEYYGGEGCSCPTLDGGEPCTRGSDCEGTCLGAPDTYPSGCALVTEGTCSDHRPVVGCLCYLDDDGLPWDICID